MEAPDPQASPMIPKTDNSDTESPEGAKERAYLKHGSWAMVLVAEDDAAFRFLLSEALSEEGYQVLSAANGVDALELYRKNADNINLVVADVVMPGMDGLTAAVEMRKIDDNVFFLFMSGYEPERIREIGINMDDIPNAAFLRKPFAFKDLISRIRMLAPCHQT
jgi:two-component system, cell cycle sensor histidine kinase and response regulator CckA